MRILFFYITVVCFLSCRSGNKSGQSEERTSYASLIDTTSYVGIQTCRQCHADKFETFRHTGMGMSFDTAHRKKSSAVFSGHPVVVDRYKNFSYHPFWKNDSLYVTEFRLEGKDTVHLRTEKISFIVGSGQHTNSHMINHNGYLYQAPVTFYTQQGKWDLPPGFEDGFNSRFSRKIELECMSCHNAYPTVVEGSVNKFDAVPSGIDCERCHGPGSAHVREKLAGKIVDVKNVIDYSIVNPAKLPISRQLDVCQRCHIQGNAVLRTGKSYFDFRPGMALSEVMNVFMPVYKGDEDAHIMASHAERMKMSACYKASVNKAEEYNRTHPTLEPYKMAMTCVTCHDPHVSVRRTDPDVFNKACRNCHGAGHSNLIAGSSLDCTAERKIRMASGDNCSGCHMPGGGAIDIPHVRVTDHWIRKPVKSEDVKKIREFIGLACINEPEVEPYVTGQAYISYYEKFVQNPAYLDSAEKYISSDRGHGSHFRDRIRIAFLRDDFLSVIRHAESMKGIMDSLKRKSYTNDDAWTAYRIGESYLATGDQRAALNYFQRAVQLAPFALDFRMKLAALLDDLNSFTEARKQYEFILKEDPSIASAHVNYGFLILRMEKDPEKAMRHYNKALTLDPDNVQAMINTAGIYIFKNDLISAQKVLRKALRTDPRNEQVKTLLARISGAQAAR